MIGGRPFPDIAMDFADGFRNRYVTCSDESSSPEGICPDGASITGPVLLYLQSATAPGVPPEDLGRQSFYTNELALFVQDTWKIGASLILNLGLRWEGVWHPDVFVEPAETFYAPYLSDPRFPSDGTIPDDLNNFQPRFGLTWNVGGKDATIVRANAGSYYARIPGLVFATPRSTNGAYQQILFRSSVDAPVLGPVPPIDELIDGSSTTPFLPEIHVIDRGLQLPRTWSFSAEVDHALGNGLAASISWQHARTNNLFRFVDRNAFALGSHLRGRDDPPAQHDATGQRVLYLGCAAVTRIRAAESGGSHH